MSPTPVPYIDACLAKVRRFFAPFRVTIHPTIVPPIHPQTRIGHVHLKVADLDRALGFYRDVLGFTVTQRIGNSAAFLAAGGYHHHIGSEHMGEPARRSSFAGYDGSLSPGHPVPQPRGARRCLAARAACRYLTRRRRRPRCKPRALSSRPGRQWRGVVLGPPRGKWPRTTNGELAMVTRPLDLHALLAEVEIPAPSLGPEDLA